VLSERRKRENFEPLLMTFGSEASIAAASVAFVSAHRAILDCATIGNGRYHTCLPTTHIKIKSKGMCLIVTCLLSSLICGLYS